MRDAFKADKRTVEFGQKAIFKHAPGREGKDGPVRVNLCHGDETRETGGLIPDWFPL